MKKMCKERGGNYTFADLLNDEFGKYLSTDFD